MEIDLSSVTNAVKKAVGIDTLLYPNPERVLRETINQIEKSPGPLRMSRPTEVETPVPQRAILMFLNRDKAGKPAGLAFAPLTHQVHNPDEIISRPTVIAHRVLPKIHFAPGDVAMLTPERKKNEEPLVVVATQATTPTELWSAIAVSDYPITAFPQRTNDGSGFCVLAQEADLADIKRMAPAVTGSLPNKQAGELHPTGRVFSSEYILQHSVTLPIVAHG